MEERRKRRKRSSIATEEEKRRGIQDLCLMDDRFMTACFDNQKPAVQLLLRIILGKPGLIVREVHVQHPLPNEHGRGLTLDIHAESEGVVYNCEVQNASGDSSPQRARYHGSLLDTHNLEKGEPFRKLPETYVIFITEQDKYGKGKPLYRFDRYSSDAGCALEDELHIIYVNGRYRGDDEMGKLMSDFSCKDADKMNYTELAQRVRYFKKTEDGGERMSNIFDTIESRAEKAGVEKGMKKGLEKGADRLGSLITKLLSQNRLDDVQKVSVDPAYREKLFKELGIA